MRTIILLLFLFASISVYAQNESKTDPLPKKIKINIKADSNNIKAISMDTLDSFMVKKSPKTEIKVAKNYMRPASDSFFDMTVYLVKKQFQEKPITMLIITALLFFGVIGIIKQFYKK